MKIELKNEVWEQPTQMYIQFIRYLKIIAGISGTGVIIYAIFNHWRLSVAANLITLLITGFILWSHSQWKNSRSDNT